jgi:putative phosphoserine phosphatase / 1-acylglycerol-3-phosphate O-acyltransferase
VTHPVVAEAVEAPYEPGEIAFFDLDRTLVHGFTANIFLRERLRSGRIGPREVARIGRDAAAFRSGRIGFSQFLVRASELYAGMPERELEELGEHLFRKRIASRVYPEAYELVRAHQQAGRRVVVVSSATRYQAGPVVRALGADGLLCSQLEVRDGVLTGGVVRPVCYGVGKLRAATAWAAEHGGDVAKSWFYSDGVEDLPLLEAVAHPRPLNPDTGLTREAEHRGWPIHRLESRGSKPGHLVRTGVGVASMLASVASGLPLLAAGRTVEARNRAERLFGDWGTRIAGITLDVDGEEHLWAHRPCVFVFNHQSAVEPLLLCKLLRQDFVGIAKAELQQSVFRPVFDYAGVVYVERFDKERAIQALEPVVQALRDGQNVVIAPEGTRSRTPMPGPFKKGAFHIARQAGVPIVPIVFHNSFAALPKKGRVVHPATVRVTVLPPVDTTGWTYEDSVAAADALRARYIEVLGASA